MNSRDDGQMMELILAVARSDARIRAVIQDGSRSNPSVHKDIFQDFDIIYIVKNLHPSVKDHRWVDVFGKRMIMQMPEDMELYPPDESIKGGFSYLLQFMDGNRIDLTLVPLKHFRRFTEDGLCKLLLDKDGLFEDEPFPPASERDYLIKAPRAGLSPIAVTSSGIPIRVWQKDCGARKWCW
ncbi:hypothetical protein GCM10010967_47320 [Dyadobacter beijingensis]|uniref:Streptomycin adenylyltransferase n=1 Tax=Dyadobacter beijingensis TaxID=365489 RepID=A0ABQ2IC12_9BACT|nr:aminoglycoside 6-adenylyltransferase [Dyadobacter beijingensis]GGN06600.1 hypothetical protein GCM10010967_47320 [Dyadobacter beijingensis]